MTLAWESCSWKVGGPGPPRLLGTPSLHCLPACQVISLHSCLGGNTTTGLSAGDCQWILRQAHRPSSLPPAEGTGPLSLLVQSLPATGLLRVPRLCGGHGSWLWGGGLSLGDLGSASCLSMSMGRIQSSWPHAGTEEGERP